MAPYIWRCLELLRQMVFMRMIHSHEYLLRPVFITSGIFDLLSQSVDFDLKLSTIFSNCWHELCVFNPASLRWTHFFHIEWFAAEKAFARSFELFFDLPRVVWSGFLVTPTDYNLRYRLIYSTHSWSRFGVFMKFQHLRTHFESYFEHFRIFNILHSRVHLTTTPKDSTDEEGRNCWVTWSNPDASF